MKLCNPTRLWKSYWKASNSHFYPLIYQESQKPMKKKYPLNFYMMEWQSQHLRHTKQLNY